ncbi:hypothetical protein Tco_0892359 [Tanacetum coccineum]|uniref:Uncharacterized protein n=1 Tax=Tanacetum coccineum TaxID=301880 RepID=A0ABQ5C8N8_9ASTR
MDYGGTYVYQLWLDNKSTPRQPGMKFFGDQITIAYKWHYREARDLSDTRELKLKTFPTRRISPSKAVLQSALRPFWRSYGQKKRMVLAVRCALDFTRPQKSMSTRMLSDYPDRLESGVLMRLPLLKCFLDAYKGYHIFKWPKMTREKKPFHTSQGVLLLYKDAFWPLQICGVVPSLPATGR